MTTAPPQNPTAGRERPTFTSLYLVSPGYDLIFFILSPLMALGLGLLLSQTPLNGDDIYDGDNWLEIGLSIFIM